MLTAITLAYFKSYRQATLSLSALTVLIGANASGKSNVIEGLRLLSWLAQGQKLSSIQFAVQSGDRVVRGKLDDLAYQHGETFGLGVHTNAQEWNLLDLRLSRRADGLHITGESLTHHGATVPLYALDQPSSGQSTDAGVAYNNFAKGRNKPRVTCNDQAAVFTQITSQVAFDAAHKASRERIPPIAKQLEKWLSAMLFLDPVPAQMRDYAFPSDTALQGNGRNVSAVLFNLWGRDDQAESEPWVSNRAAILQFIQSLPEQDIAKLSFLEEPRGGVMLKLTETFGGQAKDYDASLLSDGTLRVLAIAAAMLSAPQGSLVVIEEIDNGVHPSRASHLLQQIQSIARERSLRVLLSTHNPAMLDALPDLAIPDVVFCYRNPGDGASRLVRLADVPDYPELIAQGTLGHLMTSGALERFVKHHPTGDERKQRALDWLNQIRNGDSNG
jgi:predicted ATPase